MTTGDPRERRLKALQPWLRAVADLMGLPHWTIERSAEPPEASDHGKAAASIEPIYGRYYAILRLSDYFLDQEPPAAKRDTIAHEYIHLHLSAAHKIAEENLPEGVYPQWLLAMEYAIDGMAKSWSNALPDPPEPRAKKG